ncbi:MAG: S46 family peptidase [Bacteroidales bacterium]|nr:S46 family peptidase [Bacteroidales bacterium]
MKRVTTILFAVLLSFNAQLKADEGMWLLTMLDQLNIGTMTEMGLTLTAEDIYSINQASIKDAIVIFGGGCTGEIVSSKGLLFTNHHCGYGSIQSHSSVEHDYLRDGFWAKSLDEELVTPGLSATFLVRIEDVSDRVFKNVKDKMTQDEISAEIRKARQEISGEATEGNHYRATVNSFFGGNNYYLLVYEVYRDVRFVGAPPSSIGKYGHDTDNWEWPRHTGDFSIFRVYMGPDGKPAEFSEENIPLKPKHYLPVSIKGVKENDFAMILGYPGGTTRYMTSFEIEEQLQITHPNRIKIRGALQEVWMEDMMADQQVNIQYASKYSGSSNYWKFSIGQKAGLERLNVKGQKEKIEADFTSWLKTKKKINDKYGTVLETIQTSIDERAKSNHLSQYLSECFGRGTELTSFSMRSRGTISALKGEDKDEAKVDIERFLAASDRFYKNYNEPTDRKATVAMFSLYKEDIDKEYWPEFFNTIDSDFDGNVKLFVDNMFDNSIYTSREKLEQFFDNPDVEKMENDPAYKAMGDIMGVRMKVQSLGNNNAELAKARRLWIAGLKEMDPDLVKYPDANFTMRLTYGSVLPYQPKDAVIYKHYTTMEGIMEKYVEGDYEFDLPKDIFKLVEEKDYGQYADEAGHMPVCFLTNNDITGGNSGSPVINGNGELIGLAFDGNWEAMSGDIAFEPDLQRCINVDVRYVLWVIDKYAGAKNLIEEMEIRD